MLRTRVIPCLLLKGGGLVKTVRFSNPSYVGDPLNAVKIFNDKGVDELILLDISATASGRGPDFRLLRDVADEAFMPLGYGGGIRTVEEIRTLLSLGFEKVVINSAAAADRAFLRRAADLAGSQSVVASLDARETKPGRHEVFTHSGTRALSLEPAAYAREAEQNGAGEILVTSIDRDGTMSGYDLGLVRSVAAAVSVPVIALGGASGLPDLAGVVKTGGASAAAAGSLFVFHGRHRAVLINYPDRAALDAALNP